MMMKTISMACARAVEWKRVSQVIFVLATTGHEEKRSSCSGRFYPLLDLFWPVMLICSIVDHVKLQPNGMIETQKKSNYIIRLSSGLFMSPILIFFFFSFDFRFSSKEEQK